MRVYYRIYAVDGAIPLKTPITPGDPFLGRIRARSVPPPRNAKDVKRVIEKVENIKNGESTTTSSLFLSPCSQSPMDDSDKVTTDAGSTPLEPLALVAEISDSERSDLDSGGRGGLGSATLAEPDTTAPDIQYCYESYL